MRRGLQSSTTDEKGVGGRGGGGGRAATGCARYVYELEVPAKERVQALVSKGESMNEQIIVIAVHASHLSLNCHLASFTNLVPS